MRGSRGAAATSACHYLDSTVNHSRVESKGELANRYSQRP